MAAAVRATFGLERRAHGRYRCAEAAQHRGQHVVRDKAQPTVAYLHRGMPVAEMPRGTREAFGVRAPRFLKVLVGRAHADDPSIVGCQHVAAAQHRAAIEKKADLLAAVDYGAKPALLPQLERQHENGVGLGMGLRGDLSPDDQHREDQNRK
jgi:hypothetical protein